MPVTALGRGRFSPVGSNREKGEVGERGGHAGVVVAKVIVGHSMVQCVVTWPLSFPSGAHKPQAGLH